MIRPFTENTVSTQTFIISTNILIDIGQLYHEIPIYPLKSPLRKSRERMTVNEDGIPDGSIVFVKYKGQHKGTLFKETKIEFLNSVTLIMKNKTKYFNFKVTQKGNIQITGCNKDEYAVDCLKAMWAFLEPRQHIWSFKNGNTVFEALFVLVMSNITFSLQFEVNRQQLDYYINVETPYTSLLETSYGYTGVNIKIPITDDLQDVMLQRYRFVDREWAVDEIPFRYYLDSFGPKERLKKINKTRNNTFMVFHSGKVIMSGGVSRKAKEQAYQIFSQIITTNKDLFTMKTPIA